MKLLAWTPSPTRANLGAVLCSPDQPMSATVYVALLAERLQSLVDETSDPQRAAADLSRGLTSEGLWDGAAIAPTRVAEHVLSNPSLRERLNRHLNLAALSAAKPREMPEAREQIVQDKLDPLGQLQEWASSLR